MKTLALLSVTPFLVGAADFSKGQTVYTLGSGVNLRAKPDAAAKALAIVPIASQLEVLGTQGEWTQVRYAEGRARRDDRGHESGR